VTVTAVDIASAQAGGRIAVLISCEGGDFLEGEIARLTEARAAGASSLTLVREGKDPQLSV